MEGDHFFHCSELFRTRLIVKSERHGDECAQRLLRAHKLHRLGHLQGESGPEE